jgi:uncharacterized cupredoxin-like copper-binding protein
MNHHQLELPMKTTIKLGLALAALSTAPAFAHDQHGHGTFSAGEPGDPKKPARTIEILLNEMDYAPARIEVKRGEQIRFVLRNVGKEDHEFLLATTKENLAHAVEMKKHPHMEHDESQRDQARAEQDSRDPLEVQQGRHVRIFLPDSRPPRLRHGRPRHREVTQGRLP